MTLRTTRERMVQTLAFEAGGLLVATPLYTLLFGTAMQTSALVLLAVSAVVMIWSPLHNAAFDLAEWRLARRVASDRPHRLRLLHALSHEVTSIALTLPVLLTLGGLSLGQALMANLGLTLLYTAYAYAFHWVYDRLRPVRTPRPVAPAFREGKW